MDIAIFKVEKKGIVQSITFYAKFMWVFAMLGLQMIGNFSALLPLMEETLDKKMHWVSKEEILDSITWGRCGPGAAVINSVAYLGNKIKGPMGGFVAVLSFCFFPTVAILIIAAFMDKFLTNKYVVSVMKGLSVAVVTRIIKSNIDLWKKTIINKLTAITFFICVALMFVTDIPIIFYIIGVIFIGIIVAKAY